MRLRIVRPFFLLWAVVFCGAASVAQNFDRSNFYHVLKSGLVEEINAELLAVGATPMPGKTAFEGALLMKKAGVVKKPNDKLNLFREGRRKLETALHSDSDNVEYHFLRLIIQEHAPKVVKYQGQLDADSRYIRKYFKDLSPVLKEIVTDYCKTSRILQIQDFQ